MLVFDCLVGFWFLWGIVTFFFLILFFPSALKFNLSYAYICMCAYICVCVYIDMLIICVYIYLYASMCIYICLHTHTYVYVYTQKGKCIWKLLYFKLTFPDSVILLVLSEDKTLHDGQVTCSVEVCYILF